MQVYNYCAHQHSNVNSQTVYCAVMFGCVRLGMNKILSPIFSSADQVIFPVFSRFKVLTSDLSNCLPMLILNWLPTDVLVSAEGSSPRVV